MKKVLIAIIGKDKRYHLPLQGNYVAFNDCICKIVQNGVIAMSRQIYDALPSASPPFPDQVLYVVSEEMLLISPLAKTFVAPSWTALFETLADNGEETLFIFVDKASYDGFFSSHKEDIDAVIVAQINKKGKKSDLFEDPAIFEWFPQLIDEGEAAGKDCPGYTVHKYVPARLFP